MDSQTLLNLGLVLVFVVVGGVFAATEIALVSLRDSQLTQMERTSTRGAHVARVARDPNRFLAAVQIGVTVAGFFSAAYGGSTLAPDLVPTLTALGLPDGAAETTALVAMTLLIAYLSLVLGELVPKRLALQKSAGLAQAVTPTLDRFAILMRPVIWLLSLSTDAMVRVLGGDPKAVNEELSEEELRDLVSTHEGLHEQERKILQDVFNASRTSLREVMKPRADVLFVDAATSLVDAERWVKDQPYSRYPVIGEGFDDVLGFLHVRDLIDVDPDDRRTVGDVAREILVVPRTNMVLPAVQLMRQTRTHLAVVVDEYGGTDGIVTLEDLVEELVGEIEDEYDAGRAAETEDDPSVDGSLSLQDFEERTGLDLPDDGDYETVAGFVLARLGRIPDVGDEVAVADGASLEVEEMVGRRITRVRVHRLARDPDPASDSGADRATEPGSGPETGSTAG
jgi:putative hemolysin